MWAKSKHGSAIAQFIAHCIGKKQKIELVRIQQERSSQGRSFSVFARPSGRGAEMSFQHFHQECVPLIPFRVPGVLETCVCSFHRLISKEPVPQRIFSRSPLLFCSTFLSHQFAILKYRKSVSPCPVLKQKSRLGAVSRVGTQLRLSVSPRVPVSHNGLIRFTV